jgi:hypothetical protein
VPASAPAQQGEATEQLTERLDSERAAAGAKARRAMIGSATITPGAHATAGLANVATGDDMGEHGLASFAVYVLGR